MSKGKLTALAGVAGVVAGALVIDLGIGFNMTASVLMFIGTLTIVLVPLWKDL
jgi:hypothetical protein